MFGLNAPCAILDGMLKSTLAPAVETVRVPRAATVKTPRATRAPSRSHRRARLAARECKGVAVQADF
jgi:hypothetical protein